MYKWNPSVDEVSLLNLKLQNQKQSLYTGRKKTTRLQTRLDKTYPRFHAVS